MMREDIELRTKNLSMDIRIGNIPVEVVCKGVLDDEIEQSITDMFDRDTLALEKDRLIVEILKLGEAEREQMIMEEELMGLAYRELEASDPTLGIATTNFNIVTLDCAKSSKTRGRKSLFELWKRDGYAKNQQKITSLLQARKGKALPTDP
ncbi:hypothetical protein SUGI_0049930 [Cryptomeria japonica]|nr:hypothetical protein SUGI_0049930 [Cryptomeria japonica]